MATIKLGPIAADLRGKSGGAVFSRNRGGNYMKAFTKPVNPQTPEQQANRGLFGTLMSDWRRLTEGERRTWIDNAPNYPVKNKVGEAVNLTGPQLFAKANMVLLNAGLTPISNLPPSPVALVKAFASQAFADANPFTWDSALATNMTANIGVTFPEGTGSGDGQFVQVYASSQVSAGIGAVSSVRQRLIGVVEVGDMAQVAATNRYTHDFGPDIDAKFGLGPSIYNKDSTFVVSVYLFDETEGIAVPIGNQFYSIQDVAP